MIVEQTLGGISKPYECPGALAYRLSAPAADHFFLINDGPGKSVRLEVKGRRYEGVTDAISGEALEPGAPIALPGHSGRWLRCAK
jgi:beta-galactosidase